MAGLPYQLLQDRVSPGIVTLQQLGWAGLGWAGLGWAGLGWAGLGWAGGILEPGWTSTYSVSRFFAHDNNCYVAS